MDVYNVIFSIIVVLWVLRAGVYIGAFLTFFSWPAAHDKRKLREEWVSDQYNLPGRFNTANFFLMCAIVALAIQPFLNSWLPMVVSNDGYYLVLGLFFIILTYVVPFFYKYYSVKTSWNFSTYTNQVIHILSCVDYACNLTWWRVVRYVLVAELLLYIWLANKSEIIQLISQLYY